MASKPSRHVAAHQQQFCHETLNWKEAPPYSAIMQDEHVNLIAGDFNGAAWRQTSGNNCHQTSTLEEALADTDLPMPPGPHLCGVLELFLANGMKCAVSSYAQTHIIHGRYAYMEHSQFTEKSWVSVKGTRAANMKSGCI